MITANVCIVAIPIPLMTYGTTVKSSNGNGTGMSSAYCRQIPGLAYLLAESVDVIAFTSTSWYIDSCS